MPPNACLASAVKAIGAAATCARACQVRLLLGGALVGGLAWRRKEASRGAGKRG